MSTGQRADEGATAAPGRRRWALGAALIALAALPVALRYLVFWPLDRWQVDVEVYRDAGVSLLTGRPIYDAITEAPQLLPFTYPPFAAILAIPLALIPFGVVGWLWTIAQVLATTAIVWFAAYRVLPRAGVWKPVLLAVLVAPMLWLHPVADGIRFGQVNAFIVLACLVDLHRPRPRFLRRVPPGVLVGLAMSIKLTPGVFVVHYLVNRRWREAAAAVGAAAAATVGAFVVLPEASFAFWGGALSDPDRLGPNAGTSNQSLRGVLLRLGPEGVAGTALWLACVAVVAVVGYAVARRFWRAGDTVAEVAVVGLLAVLLSPVAWIHHLHWMVVVIFAVLGAQDRDGTVGRDGRRDRVRLLAAALLTVWFLCRLPWWGITWLANGWPAPVGRLLQNADTLGALLALAFLWWLSRTVGEDAQSVSGGVGSASDRAEVLGDHGLTEPLPRSPRATVGEHGH